MDLIYIFFTSLGSIIFLFILAKIMGNRQISQLGLFDYINGITIGTLAGQMATSIDGFAKSLVAMLVYSFFTALISTLTCKSIKLRKIVTGKPIVLYENGKIYKENLKYAKIDINEFLTQCRISGYFDLSHIHTAILETNGRISFLPMVPWRPTTPEDFGLAPEQEKPVSSIIIDGKIMKENLAQTGNNIAWLQDQLHRHNIKDVSEVFFATCDSKNQITIYLQIKSKVKKEI